MLGFDDVDLVGYESELALEVCRRLGIKAEVKVTGATSDEDAMRVVRQQWRGGSLILTCACEAWA